MLREIQKIWRIARRYPHFVTKKENCCVLGGKEGKEYGSFGVAKRGLKDNMIVFSFGVGEDISFDKDCITRFHAKVYAFDPTPKSIRWIKENGCESNHFIFYPIGLGTKDGPEQFHLPVNEEYVSGSVFKHDSVKYDSIEVKMMTISSIYHMIFDGMHPNIDLLKMDIEGSEFDVIPLILDFVNNEKIDIKQICLEWHGRFFEDGRKRVRNAHKLLRKSGYELVYISEDTYTYINMLR